MKGFYVSASLSAQHHYCISRSIDRVKARTIERINGFCKSYNKTKDKMEIKQAVGELVRQKRVKKGWSQEQLSSEAGISNRFLQDIEAGEKMTSLTTLFKLSDALGVTPDKLILPVWKEWIRG